MMENWDELVPGLEYSYEYEECIRFGCGHKRYEHVDLKGRCKCEARNAATPHCPYFARTTAELESAPTAANGGQE